MSDMMSSRPICAAETVTSRRHFVWPCIGFGLGVLTTWPVWQGMWLAGWNGSGQAWLALPIAFYLLWQRRHALHDGPTRNWAGVAWALSGVLSLGLGVVFDVVTLVNVGAVSVACGLAASVLPMRSIRALAPVAVAFIFAIPIPGSVSGWLTLPLARFNAEAVGAVLRWLGLPIQVLGTVLFRGNIEIEVAEACAGMRFFWPVLLLSFALCCTRGVSLRRTLVVLAFATVIALIINFCRLLIVIGLYNISSATVAGCAHDMSGWIVIGGAWLVPFAGLRFLAPRDNRARLARSDNSTAAVMRERWRADQLIPFLASIGVVAVSAAIAVHAHAVPPRNPVHIELVDAAIHDLPYRLENLIGKDSTMPAAQIRVLQPDALLSRRYENLMNSERFLVTITYQWDGRSHAGHHAARCYSARGWDPVGIRQHDWSFGSYNLSGSEHQFTRRRGGAVETIFVHEIPLLAPATVAGGGRRTSAAARARVQLVFPSPVDRDRRDRLTIAVLSNLGDLLDLLQA